MKNRLEIDSINKSYGFKKILSDIYLKCETNDIIGVFGKNGCGKSTLLKIIYGTLSAENKFIKLNDSVLKIPFKQENGLSYLPQNNFIPNNLVVKKAIILSIDNINLFEFYDDLVIKTIINKKIKNLSGGELKYLQVKLILFNDAKFCLLDEPYSGISPIFANHINQMILERSKFKGIIIADHNYNYLLEVATKIYLIKDGYGKIVNNKEELVKEGYLTIEMLNY